MRQIPDRQRAGGMRPARPARACRAAGRCDSDLGQDKHRDRLVDGGFDVFGATTFNS